ncbi:hypothetical protein KFK09_001315 [Dendrobium nobile]|uniref:Uncharacterized protein n=1 Tax=Dendrobium nobile TaxID=94219 RepID=A0A8T3C4S7_DENNO|nr:hypothetical protein KFK09_001315 [Dendrobium nobile]
MNREGAKSRSETGRRDRRHARGMARLGGDSGGDGGGSGDPAGSWSTVEARGGPTGSRARRVGVDWGLDRRTQAVGGRRWLEG